jgi:hypothetical protein
MRVSVGIQIFGWVFEIIQTVKGFDLMESEWQLFKELT